jgi:hypothetical protein
VPPLNEAENKFFQSRGAEVDASLSAPAAEPEPTGEADPAAPAASSQTAAPAPATAAAPEVKPADPVAQQAQQAPQVPISALHEERRRRAEAEQTARALQQQIEQFQRAVQQAQTPEPPDPNEDPVGALRYQNEQLSAQLQQVLEWRAQQDRAAQQQSAYAALTERVNASEQSFRQAHPDYDQASQHLLETQDRFLQAFYPDPNVRALVLRQQAANVLAQAVQQGRDPAQVLYDAARNVGYTGAAAGTAAGAAAAPAVAPAQGQAQAAAEVVKTIEKGLKQQTTIGSGGATPPSEMTPQMLAGLSGAEFQEGWKKMFGRR